MKLKTPITDTREIVELALLVMHGAACANVPKEVCPEVGKALALMVQTAERMYGEAEGTDCHGAEAPRNDKDGQKKRAVYPDIYDHSNKPFLFSRLFDYAEWAECNEWEVPLCMADDLRAAAKFIRFMGEQHPDVCAHYEEAKKGAAK